MTRNMIRKLFAVDCFFSIAIKRRDENIMEKMQFTAENTVYATRQEWCADPFLAEYMDRTYLFYEKVHGDLGSIEVAEVMPDCRLSAPSVLFEGTHYSYPYVFQKDNQWYMIPESAALNEVSLYVAEQFPYRWKKEAVLLQMKAVDTTVFQIDEKWYLLTFVPVLSSERVIPYVYRMNGFNLEPIQWSDYDPLCVRGAGSPFVYQGKLIRPVQISTNTRYGDKVAFVEIHIDKDSYFETVVKELTPKSLKLKGLFYDGLHTYNASEHYEVIDIRCGKLSWSKPLRKICRFQKK